MTAVLKTYPASPTLGAPRAILHCTVGNRNGPITRLMSPSDIGELIKPFIFLDLFEVETFEGRGFAPHPHSGIATLTTFLEGSMTYADSTDKTGRLSVGAVEWMRAGGGVWHAGNPAKGAPMRGYQLWLALPPTVELAEPESLYLEPDKIRTTGPARVLLGSYGGITSPVPQPSPMTYLHVRLQDGESWTYEPDSNHDVAWLALNSGKLRTSDTVLDREMVVFAEGHGSIDLTAEGAVEFVIGSAVKHPYPLIHGHYSVHTSPEALAQGERNIAELERSPKVAALHHI